MKLEAKDLQLEAKDLNRGAMVFDSQGCKPLVGVPGMSVNGGAVALFVLVIGYMRWSIAIWDAPGESMPSLRDSRFVVGCIPGVYTPGYPMTRLRR